MSLGIIASSYVAPTGTSLADAILALAPVGYWKLDESSGSSAADSSGNGRNGTYNGTHTLANVDGLVSLNGGYIEVSDNADWSITTEPGLTVFALIKPTATPTARQFIVTKGQGSAYEWDFNVNSSAALQGVTYAPAGVVQGVESFSSIVTTDWQAVALATDAVTFNHRFDLYRNSGTPLASSQPFSPDTSGTNADGAAPLRIGWRGDSPGGQNLVGAIGHVALFPGRLSDAQVGTLMTAAAGEGWI